MANLASAAAILALGWFACACGDSKESTKPSAAETKCRLDVTLTGAIEFESGSDSFVCASTIEQGPGVFMIFIQRPREGDLVSIAIGVPNVDPEEVGPSFSASLTLEHADGRGFSAGCAVEIRKNALDHASEDADVYTIEGSGTCDPPPMPSGDDVTVGPFSFVGTAAWQL